MKIWEKVNNITGNSSKARYLIEYINAGAKFILAALPEKFLWTIASESEVKGFDSDGNSIIGSGSSISYDKILAVYRYDGGKRRVCAEAPDKNIHIFDEAGSLLRATEMFPKYYKLSGKIFIKPDPDYNAHIGVGNAYQHTYIDLDGNSVAVNSEEGDKGVIVYSAPPVVDENTDSWILAEYENIAIFYAASLDFLRLSSVYRDLCKAQIDAAVGSLLTSYRNAVPSFDPTKATDDSTSVSIPSGTLSFSVSTSLPSFSFSDSLPSDFDISSIQLPSAFSSVRSIPSFSFSGTLPDPISLSSALPTSFNISKSLPSSIEISSSLPSDLAITSTIPSAFNINESLPSALSLSTQLPTGFSKEDASWGDFSLSSTFQLPSDIQEQVDNFSSTSADDALYASGTGGDKDGRTLRMSLAF